MKKEKREKYNLNFSFSFSERVAYTLIVILIVLIAGVGVWAVAGTTPNPGHSLAQLQPCSDGEILKMSGGVWSCIDIWSAHLDIKKTTATHNGNFVNIGDSERNGYRGMYNWIQSNGCSGYHVCDNSEVARALQMKKTITPPSSISWYTDAVGTTGAGVGTYNNCYGWSSNANTFFGISLYTGSSGLSIPVQNQCNDALPVLCCK